MKKIALTIFVLLIAISSFAGKKRTILKRGSKVYIESKNTAEKIHLEKALEYKETYKVVNTSTEAEYVLKIVSKSGLNYRAFVQIIDPKTGTVLERTTRVNTFWSITVNPKLTAMRKLVRKRLKPAR